MTPIRPVVRHLLVASVILVARSGLLADALGNGAEITPISGWVATDPKDPDLTATGFPTLKYIPVDGRNATVLVTLVTSRVAKVGDLASLKAMHLRGCAPLLPSPGFVPVIRNLAMNFGFGVYSSFEDPSLAGKPPQKGNYKIATPVAVLLKNGFVIQATVFSDDKAGQDFTEALAIIQSASAPKMTDQVASDSDSIVGPDATLRLPPGRFTPMPDGLNSNPSYFSYQDGKGVILSGWLDQASNFPGMKPFWAKEKAAIQGKAGIQLKAEIFKRIGDWDAVRYVVPIGDGAEQKNIRACRVNGGTWADVHVSITAVDSTWEDLEDAVRSLDLVPNKPDA